MNSACHASQGKRRTSRRNAKKISETDKVEIAGTVSLVLSGLNAWNRPLDSEVWNHCFSRVESVDCLELNRRWKRLENATAEELTLERLAAPVFDVEIDLEREAILADRKAECIAWIQAASRVDKGRKAQATLAKWTAYLENVCAGNEEAGKPDRKNATAETLKNYRRERRRKRAEFRAYLETGKLALQAERLTRSAYLPTQVALESITLS